VRTGCGIAPNTYWVAKKRAAHRIEHPLHPPMLASSPAESVRLMRSMRLFVCEGAVQRADQEIVSDRAS
jgi:hypothetical protein